MYIWKICSFPKKEKSHGFEEGGDHSSFPIPQFSMEGVSTVTGSIFQPLEKAHIVLI